LVSKKVDYNDYLSNWVDEQSYDTLTIKVLEYLENTSICGSRPSESLTIGYIPRHDTIRILVLCEIDTTNWVGSYRTFVAGERPPFPTGVRKHHSSKYDLTVSKTVWGYFINRK
jgi:hypothetical protein